MVGCGHPRCPKPSKEFLQRETKFCESSLDTTGRYALGERVRKIQDLTRPVELYCPEHGGEDVPCTITESWDLVRS